MSSEMYLRWELQRRETLRRQQEEALRREIEQLNHAAAELKSIRAQAEQARRDALLAGSSTAKKGERLSNFQRIGSNIYISSGYEEGKAGEVARVTQADSPAAVQDWHARLEQGLARQSGRTRKLERAEQLIRQLEGYSADRLEPFVQYLDRLLADESLEYDCFCQLAEQQAEQLAMAPPENDLEELEYLACCQMLGEKSQPVAGAQRTVLLNQMKARLLRKAEEDFVYQNLKEVMAELGLSVEGEMTLNGLPGQRLTAQGIEDCAIFLSKDSDGFLLETVGEAEGTLSSNGRAMLEQNAHSICQKHLEVMRRMKARGILLNVECMKEPEAAQLQVIQHKSGSGKQRAEKQELHMGE